MCRDQILRGRTFESFFSVTVLKWIQDVVMQLNRPYFNYSLMQQYYSDRRKKLNILSRDKWNTKSLMIDCVVCQLGEKVEHLWKREEGTGKYPPASLHALLDLYLLENADEMSKHAITIYFLLDIMYSSPDKPNSSIESFPTAFSVPCGLVKLIQGFWLLDHNDYQNSVDCILHPAASRLMPWQHNQIIETLMCQGVHRQALRYIQAIKPAALTCEEVKLHITVLLANKNLIEAWNLQKLNSTRLHVEELLKHIYETCQEKGLMEDLLKLMFDDSEQKYLHNFLQTSGCLQNQELLLVHHLQRASYIPALQINQSLKGYHMNDSDRRLQERAMTRNSILDHYSKVLPRVQRIIASERAKPYTLSSTIWKEVTRPKPLSTVAKQAPGNVITKASFIRNVLMKVKEVSTASENMEISPYKRLLDSVVHPVLALSPPLHKDIKFISEKSTYGTSRLLTLSPAQPILWKMTQMKNLANASEFNLLETPSIVKRAKALTSNTISSIFVADMPQSILRSSARTSPLASPSISPGRSDTPPLQARESKMSMDEITTKSTKRILTPDHGMPGSSLVQKSQDSAWMERIVLLTNHLPVSNIDVTAIQDGILIETEASREASNVSGRLDQTTLSCEDASKPEYFEGDTTVESWTLLNKDTLISAVDNIIAAEPQQIKEDLERGGSIYDGKEIPSKHPEHINEVVEVEVNEEINEDLQLAENKVMLNEISAQFPQCVEVKGIKENKVVESDLKTCINWYTTEDIHLECDDLNIGPLYKCELSAERGPVNDETNDAEIEHAVAPSNFTLFLDKREDESIDTTAIETNHPAKLKTFPEVLFGFSKEHINHETKITDADPANVFVFDCEQKEEIFQPSRVAVEKNFLNEFKDTRSENVTAEVTIESDLTKPRNVNISSRIPAQEEICIENIVETIQADMIPENSNDQGHDVETEFLQKEVKLVLISPQSLQRNIRKSTEATGNSNEVENTPSVRRHGKKIKEHSGESADFNSQEKQFSLRTLRTRSSVHKKTEDTKEELTRVQEIPAHLPFIPSRTRRGKTPALSEDMLDPNVAISLPPTRLTRSSIMMPKTDKKSSNQTIGIDENKQVATPSRRRKHAVNELVKHFEHNASLVSIKEEINLPISRKWSSIKTENQIDKRFARDEQIQSEEQSTLVPRKMVRRSTIAKLAEVSPVAAEKSLKPQAEEGVLTKLTDKVNISTVRQTRRSTLPSVSEENMEKNVQVLQSQDGEDAVSNVPSTKKQSKKARLTRTRASKTLPDNSTNTFVFTSPTPKHRRNVKAIKVDHSPEAIQSAVSSQYVFSPPSVRTRRTTPNMVSEKEQVPKAENTEAEVPQELLVKLQRGRPAKQKAKKKGKSTDKPAWSPPAVEIQLLSSPESQVVDSDAAKITSPETKVLDRKPMRRNRKIIASKAITHRKIR
ncbi:protein ELYS-like [Hyperolius riggenbachi]|uniref:protein ELYS-like n=1 Tax=Hyperolius riggenbachi TaxID=752182 RepID=UPI0035A3D097